MLGSKGLPPFEITQDLPVVMTMTRIRHHRLEDFKRFLVGNASAVEHEPNGKIAFD